jgi:hypothetical protein
MNYKQLKEFQWSGADQEGKRDLNKFLKDMTGGILDIQCTHTQLGSTVYVIYIPEDKK